MRKVINEIREVFERELLMKNIHFIGFTCMGRIEGDLLGKIALGGTAIRVSILDRTSGLVDEMKFYISDVIGGSVDEYGKYVQPSLENIDGSSWWNCKMEEQNYQLITDALNGYLEMFQSEVQTQEAKQRFGMARDIIY